MQLPPPPDIVPKLSSFLEAGLYCDVCIRFDLEPQSPRLHAHRVVLAAFSSFFAEVCQESVLHETRFQDVFVPSAIKVNTLSFVVHWMYNDEPKLESLEGGDDDDGGALEEYLQNLRLAAEILGIPDLLSCLDAFVNGEVKVKEEAEDFPTNKALTWKEPVVSSQSLKDIALTNSFDASNVLPNPNCESFPENDFHLPLDNSRPSLDDDVQLDNICAENVTRLPNGLLCEGSVSGESASEVDIAKTNQTKQIFLATKDNDDGKRQKISNNESVMTDTTVTDKTLYESDNQLITCEKCGVRIPKKSADNHRWSYHGSKTSRNGRVDRLVKSIKNDPEISPLIALTNGQMVFSCSLCSFFKSRDASKKGKNGFERQTFYIHCAKHLYQQHDIVSPNVCFPCPIEGCTTVSYLRPNLKLHQRVHLSDYDVPSKAPCSICGKLLKPASLRVHLQDFHRNENQPKYPCSMCDKTFINQYYVKIHEQKHNVEKKYVCPSCDDYKTNDRQSYRHHRYREHGVVEPKGSKVHECDFKGDNECDYKSPVLHYVNHHRKTSHADGALPCTEPTCDKTFSHVGLLRTHVKTVHEGGYKSKCPECDQVFLSPGGLRYHKWRVHNIGSHGAPKDSDIPLLKKPFQCVYCHHSSGLVGNLKKHHKNIHPDLVFKFVDLRTIPDIPEECGLKKPY